MEERAGRRTHDLRIEHVDALPGEDDGVSPCRVSSADDRAGVAGVADVEEDRDEARVQGGHVLEGCVGTVEDGDDPLGVGAHRVEDLVRAGPGRDARLAGGVDDLRVPVSGRLRQEQVAHQVRRVTHSFADALRALDDEATGARTHRTPGQRPD